MVVLPAPEGHEGDDIRLAAYRVGKGLKVTDFEDHFLCLRNQQRLR